MGDFPTIGQAIITEGNIDAYGTLIVGDPSAADVWGPWTELIEAVPTEADALHLTVTAPNAGAGIRCVVELGVGAAGAERTLLPGVMSHRVGGAEPPYLHPPYIRGTVQMLVPIQVAKGARLSARCIGDQRSASAVVKVHLCASSGGSAIGPFGAARSYGLTNSAGTVVDPGSDLNAKGAWTVLSTATASDIAWMMLFVGCPRKVINNEIYWIVDVGVGPAGSEQVHWPDLVYGSGWIGGDEYCQPGVISLPLIAPAGSRLSVRAQPGNAATPERLLEMSVIGFG